MITPEEQVKIDKARMEKSQQIQSFTDAKTDQIIKTSAFNGAVDLTAAGLGDEVLPNIKTLADKLEAELRERILGKSDLPF